MRSLNMAKETEGNVRSAGTLLQSLEDGQLLEDLSTNVLELNTKLTKHAEAVGKAKGEIRLTLKFVADQGGTVSIDSDITIKEPKALRARTVLWTTKSGHLSSENPKQTKLPLREVDRPAAARDVAVAAPETRSV
jgi:hypothetical protein